jgi:integrase/recombinase XerD
MLIELFPRAHARFTSLPLLGPHLEGFAAWLQTQGYHPHPIRLRIRASRRLALRMQRRGVQHLGAITAAEFRAFAPKDSQEDIELAATVHSWVRYLETQRVWTTPPSTPDETLLAEYGAFLASVRGFAMTTVGLHVATVTAWLTHLGRAQVPACLHTLTGRAVEDFLVAEGARLSRATLQHTVAHLRAFLRFLAARGFAVGDLATQIDTPRVYRDERLPRALPWETVGALLRSIDRATPMGRRDYAMLLLVATYGLRTSEVVALTLDDVAWRDARLRVPRPKVRAPLELPLTPEVGAALIAYVRDGRPPLPTRRLFLRVRAPAGVLRPTAVTEAFQGCVRRSELAIPFQGPHCLRHSLAVHLLRSGTTLKVIGDLLGHRSAESTCVYLRLQIDDLRDVALALPSATHSEVGP